MFATDEPTPAVVREHARQCPPISLDPRCFALPSLWSVAALAPYSAEAQNRLPSSAEIDTYLTSVIRDTRIPGIVALVVDADRVVYTGAFGRQDVAGGVPMAERLDFPHRIDDQTRDVGCGHDARAGRRHRPRRSRVGLLARVRGRTRDRELQPRGQELHDAPRGDADDGSALADAHVGLGLCVLEPHLGRARRGRPAPASRACRCCTTPARAGPTARARACSARSSRKCRGSRSTSSCPSASSCRSAWATPFIQCRRRKRAASRPCTARRPRASSRHRTRPRSRHPSTATAACTRRQPTTRNSSSCS